MRDLLDDFFFLAFLLGVLHSSLSEVNNPKRTRKLLLKKREIQKLEEVSSQKGRTLVPLAFITAGNHIKLEFGVGRGKKQHDKRRELKKKAIAMDTARELKGRGR